MIEFNPQLGALLTKSLNSLQADDYRRAADILKTTQDNLQKKIYELTSSQLENIMLKMEHQHTLTKSDIEILKLWLVGEAESYVRMESSYKEWQKDYLKLINAFKKYEKKSLKLAQLTELSGLIEDAKRLVYLISNYLDKQERILNFEKNISSQKSLNNKFLLETLRNKLNNKPI